MKKIVFSALFLMVTLYPSFAARTNTELDNITINEWNFTLNEDEKSHACSLWIKQFYKKGIFTNDIINDIRKDPEFVFNMMIGMCVKTIPSSDRIGVPRNSNVPAKEVLYKIFKLSGAFKPDLSIWED